MKYTVESIRARFSEGDRPEIILFWGHTVQPGQIRKSCFSQWFDCVFEEDGVTYHTSEQYMMAQKALLFGDRETYKKIMEADSPKAYKALGREVTPFDAALWDAHKYEIVLRGNLAKFSQNQPLLAFLLNTGDSVLAEASPYDGVWGIRLGVEDPKAKDPALWQGENLLGFALMEVRDILRGGGGSV